MLERNDSLMTRPARTGMARRAVRSLRARVDEARGQVTVEWLMVAGLLTAMAIIIMGIVPAVLVRIVTRIAMSLRTIAP